MSMPNLFVSVGHCQKYPGACYGKLIEYDLNLLLRKKLVDLFHISKLKVSFIEVPLGSLDEKVAFINSKAMKGDLALELHFNASNNLAANGFEVLYYPGSVEGLNFARVILGGFSDVLPFTNRGIKERSDLFFLRKTNIPSIITEPLFLSNEKEAFYLKYTFSLDVIAKAILRGVLMIFFSRRIQICVNN
jgi:N-acetylmuramoyl-L-alanine amidase